MRDTSVLNLASLGAQDLPTRMLTPSERFARAAFALQVLAVVLLLSLHGLKADYDIRSYMISDYSVGPWGWVMRTMFFVWGASVLGLALSLLTGSAFFL
mgnify:CR=1 FL=1